MTQLEREVRELTQLVDGQEPWSHRKRLHLIEVNDRGVEMAAQAVKALRHAQSSHVTQLREWGGFVAAAAAIAIAVWK